MIFLFESVLYSSYYYLSLTILYHTFAILSSLFWKLFHYFHRIMKTLWKYWVMTFKLFWYFCESVSNNKNYFLPPHLLYIFQTKNTPLFWKLFLFFSENNENSRKLLKIKFPNYMSEFSFFEVNLKITFYLPITNTFWATKVHHIFENFFNYFLASLEPTPPKFKKCTFASLRRSNIYIFI